MDRPLSPRATTLLVLGLAALMCSPACLAQGRRTPVSPSSGIDRIPRDRGGRNDKKIERILSIAWGDDTPKPATQSKKDPTEKEPSMSDLRRLLGDATSATPSASGSAPRRHKPRLIYFFRGSIPEAERRKKEARLFDHESIVLASHFFSCRRIDVEKLPAEDPRLGHQAQTPSFAFEDLNGETPVRATKITNHRALERIMQTFWAHQYRGKMKTTVRRYRKVLDEMDRLEDRRMNLRSLTGALRMELTEKDSKSLKRRLESAKKHEVEATKKLQSLRKQKEKLLDPPLAKDWTWNAPSGR